MSCKGNPTGRILLILNNYEYYTLVYKHSAPIAVSELNICSKWLSTTVQGVGRYHLNSQKCTYENTIHKIISHFTDKIYTLFDARKNYSTRHL